MTYQEHLARIAELDAALRADDPRLSTSVLINHMDGMFLQHHCFYEQVCEYLYVFGEHIKAKVWPLDEITTYAMFELNRGNFGEPTVEEQLAHLLAEKKTVERFILETSPEEVITLASWQGRLKQIESEILELRGST